MKSQAFKIPVGVLAFLCFGLTVGAQAQNTLTNHVTVTASDEVGSEMAPMLPAFDTAAFTIKRTGPTNQALTVYYSVSGTATAEVDYQKLPGHVTIPAGATEATVLVYPIDDLISEPTETVILTIEPATVSGAYGLYLRGTPATATVYIRDNEPAELPVIAVTATDDSAREINPLLDVMPDIGVFTFTRTGSTNAALTVSFLIGGTAGNGVDYAEIPASVSFPAGARETTVVISPLDDTLVEGDESVTVTLRAVSGAYNLGQKVAATVTIHDDDVRPTLPVVSVVATDAEAAEPRPVPPGMGMPTVLDVGEFTISRTGPPEAPLQVFFNITSNSAASDPTHLRWAINGEDFELITSPVIIPAGATSVVVQVIPIDDNLVEATEVVQLNLFVPVSFAPTYSLGQPASAMVAIRDNDQPPPVVTIRATDAEAAEPNPLALRPYLNPGEFTVFRSGSTNESLTIYLSVGGTAANGVDYTKIEAAVTIPAGATSAPIAVVPLGDDQKEGTETVKIKIEAVQVIQVWPPIPIPYLPGTPAEAEVRILDFQSEVEPLPVVTVTATDPEAAEPNPVPPGMGMPTVLNGGEFTISRTGPTNEPLEVFFDFYSNSVSSGGAQIANLAINGVDFEKIEGPVTIPAGATSVVVRLIPLDDELEEKTEIAWLYLYEPTTFAAVYTIGQPGSARVSILDNDQPPIPVVTIRATDPEAAEPNSSAGGTQLNAGQFTVYRTGPTNQPLTVAYDIEGTAANGVDYARIETVVTIPAGATSAPIAIVPLGDNLKEGTETVRLSIPEPPVIMIYPPVPPAYLPGTPAAAEVRILDSPAPPAHPPFVAIVSPPNGARFIAPASITIRAEARDPVDNLRAVEFFAGSQWLGIRQAASNSGTFVLTWTNVMPGEYSLTARATDLAGNAATSAPVWIVVNDRAPRVIRSLPAGYAPGMKFTVSLQATPTAQVLSWAVEDQPPAGWSVGAISNGGAYDATFGKVKFGPFLDNAVRTLTYEVTPPPDASGVYEFAGTASFDGVSQPIGGASAIGLRQHPADRNPADWRITMDELTAYSTAWRLGTTNDSAGGNPAGASNASPPISYVTRAGMLWKNGEYYTLDPVITTPPLCWVSLPKAQASGLEDPANPAEGTPEFCPAQSTMPANYQGGVAFTVSLVIQPKAGTSAYAVEETIPAGWVVANVSDNGWFQSATRKVRWGPFLDDATRTLAYTVVPAVDAPRLCTFQGVASFDGVNMPIAGRRVIACAGATPPATINHADRNQDGLPVFTFVGEVGRTFVIESSTDFLTWLPVRTVTNHVGIITHTDTEAPALERRFYRARLLP